MLLLAGSAPIGLLPRRLAWDVLQAVAAGAYADVALERTLRETPLLGPDRALATELAYGAIRRRRGNELARLADGELPDPRSVAI